MNKKVSIIIPVYKVEDEIERCLKSVIKQTYQELNVILVDDCSPDNSISIAQKIISSSTKSNMFKIITHEKNKGLSAARNTGIAVADGDYIYFLDSDDELYDEKSISILVSNAEQYNADIVFGNYERIWPKYTCPSIYKNQMVLKGEQLVEAYVNGAIPIMAWNQLISYDFLSKSGLKFMEGILNEDNLFSYHVLFKKPVVSLCGVVTYKNYVRDSSIMNTFNINRLISPIIVYEETLRAYKEINGNDARIFNDLDHFAFKRYVAIFQSNADDSTKYQLYKRLRKAQSSIKGVGKMRYIYNCHLFMPTTIGYNFMKIVAKQYAQSRNLI